MRQEGSPKRQRGTLVFMAGNLWREFQLRYTAGDALADLAVFLTVVVEGYERAAEIGDQVPENDYAPVFTLNDPMDEYVDYIGLLSAAVLLHREDLIPRIHALLAGTDFDEADLLVEELLNFYLPDRPMVDQWFWDKPYGILVEVIDSETAAAKVKGMQKYVTKWYSSMKGQAHFWGKHEKITPEYSDYVGYWAFCAAAFTYLYDIDDSGYRNETVYPKDLVDYARSKPRQPVRLKDGNEILRVAGGQPCPQTGNWFSPAKEDSARHFKEGELMPTFNASEYGQTIWQWSPSI
ncbi:hypothetical protein ASD15_00795 [Massilia sp. Root351]|nr:hypothetical protein ASD15_00795 [Massilia sp. Root351]